MDMLIENVPSSSIPSELADINNTIILTTTEQWSNIIGGTTLSGTITFNQETTGIESSDFRVINGTGILQEEIDPTDPLQMRSSWAITIDGSSANDGEPIRVTAIPPSNTDGLFKLRLKENTVSQEGGTNNAPSNNKDSLLAYVRASSTGVITWNDESGGLALSANLGSNINLVDIEPSDFTVLDNNNAEQNWDITVNTDISTNTAILNRGESLKIIANPPNQIKGDFKLRLKSKSVRSESIDADGETQPRSLATDGTTVWMIGDTNNQLYTLNLDSGEADIVNPGIKSFGVGETKPTGITYIGSPINKLFMVGRSNKHLYEVNTTNGAATRIGSVNNFDLNLTNPGDLATDNTNLWMVNNENRIYQLNTTTGIATSIPNTIHGLTNITGIANHPNTNTLYVLTSASSGNGTLYTLDTSYDSNTAPSGPHLRIRLATEVSSSTLIQGQWSRPN